MFDVAVIHFGIEIENAFEGKNNRNKNGEYIRPLADFLREPSENRNKKTKEKLLEVNNYLKSLAGENVSRVYGVEVEYDAR